MRIRTENIYKFEFLLQILDNLYVVQAGRKPESYLLCQRIFGSYWRFRGDILKVRETQRGESQKYVLSCLQMIGESLSYIYTGQNPGDKHKNNRWTLNEPNADFSCAHCRKAGDWGLSPAELIHC